MSKRSINQAIAAYQAANTPAAIRSTLADLKRIGFGAGYVSAASVRADRAAELRDAIVAAANH